MRERWRVQLHQKFPTQMSSLATVRGRQIVCEASMVLARQEAELWHSDDVMQGDPAAFLGVHSRVASSQYDVDLQALKSRHGPVDRWGVHLPPSQNASAAQGVPAAQASPMAGIVSQMSADEQKSPSFV
jgi:hypothetical protein